MTRAPRLALALALALAGALAPSAPAAAQPRPAKLAPKLTKPPKLVTFVEAPYPASERATGRASTVVLQIAISATGTVDAAVVTESGGAAFDAAALEAVQKFVFEPAEIDNKPAAVKILYRYAFAMKVEAPTTAVFEGVVRARGTQKPLAHVTVAVEGGPKAVTDAAGRFRIEAVGPGKHAVTLEGEKLTALRTEETFEAGKRLEATYDVGVEEPPAKDAPSGDDVEIVVTLPPLEKKVVSTEVPVDEGRKVPGASGDVLKVVENLPGVARAAVGSGALVVWGAAPQDTRVYVDGVRVPRLYHDGGLRSVVHTDMVQSVDLAPGGYGAAYGGGLGGLVTVQLRPLSDTGFHGSVATDVYDVAGSVRASVDDRLHVAVAARKSWLDAILPLFTSNNNSALFPVPRYGDGQLRVSYKVDARTTVEAGAMISSDSTSQTTPTANPSLRETQTTSLLWDRVYARLRHETDTGGVVTVTPWVGADQSSLVSAFGAIPTELEVDSLLFGLRAGWRGKTMPGVVVSVGVDAEAIDTAVHRNGSVTQPPREGDVFVFGQAPSDQVNADDFRVVSATAAPYVEADFALADDRLHILPGLRFAPYVLSTNRRTPTVGDQASVGVFTSEALFDPRVAVTYDVSSRMRAKIAYGRYHQLPDPADLSAVFGNPLLESARADHFLASARLVPLEGVSVETTGFYTTSAGLAARDPSPSPPLAGALQQTGSGRSYGVQILIRKELTSHLFGWLSYTLSRAERQDYDGARWRLFDYDQTHVFTALASYAIGKGFEAGARFRVASGYPRTPVVGSYLDARTDTYQPIFGVQNTIRIPAFASLDLRVSKHFDLGRTELDIVLEVQNVTNRQNPEELVYTPNFSDASHPGYITGLPILPSLGIRFAW